MVQQKIKDLLGNDKTSKQNKSKIRKQLQGEFDRINQKYIRHLMGIKNVEMVLFDKTEKLIVPELKITENSEKNANDKNGFHLGKSVTFTSDNNYAFLRKETGSEEVWPSLYSVIKERRLLTVKLPSCKNNKFGCYIDPAEQIDYILKYKMNELNLNNNKIRISLRGDKTLCGQNKGIFNFCFSLPDEGKIAKTAFGNYTLEMFKMLKDDYKTLDVALNEIVQGLYLMKNKITINDNLYEICFTLAGDLAWLHTERGLLACSANYSCHICELKKSSFYKNLLEHNTEKRSLKRGEVFMNSKSNSLGYSRRPIFFFIEYINLIHDTLHEMIRIVNYILKLVHYLLIEKDNKNSTDLYKLPAQERFFEWLYKITGKAVYKIKGEKDKASENNFILNTFTGDVCRKIAQNFNIEAVLVLGKTGEIISQLFNDYYRIHMNYIHGYYLKNFDKLQPRLNQWKKMFLSVFLEKHITCYIHIFTDHLSEWIQLHGDIDAHNIQGLVLYLLNKDNQNSTRMRFQIFYKPISPPPIFVLSG